jgi:hypothetical protein
LFPEHAIFLAQVVDRLLLLLVHPSGHRDQHKPERIENLVHLQTTLCQPSQHVRLLGRYAIPIFGPTGLVTQIGSVEYSRERRFIAKLQQWLKTIRTMWPGCPARLADGRLILDHAVGIQPTSKVDRIYG